MAPPHKQAACLVHPPDRTERLASSLVRLAATVAAVNAQLAEAGRQLPQAAAGAQGLTGAPPSDGAAGGGDVRVALFAGAAWQLFVGLWGWQDLIDMPHVWTCFRV